MGFAQVASLFVVMLTLALIPSASVAVVVTRSVTHGIPNGIAVVLGIVLGDLAFMLLAILGLSVVAVWYYRENPENEAPPVGSKIIKMVIDNKLPISFSTKPDFSDTVDVNGVSKPR